MSLLYKFHADGMNSFEVMTDIVYWPMKRRLLLQLQKEQMNGYVMVDNVSANQNIC